MIIGKFWDWALYLGHSGSLAKLAKVLTIGCLVLGYKTMTVLQSMNCSETGLNLTVNDSKTSRKCTHR